MSCTHNHLDGAYVLGSLSASERREYEQHLRTCEPCTRAVGGLAGLPGLLSRVPVDVLDEPDGEQPDEPAPDVLPALLRRVRRDRRRRTTVTAGLAAAAAAVVLGGSAVALGALDEGAPQEQQGTVQAQPDLDPAREMTRVGDLPMSASVSLTSVPWGTRLDLSCSYASPAKYDTSREWLLALVVHTRGGGTEEVATWRAEPGQNMKLTAATAVEADEITSVEVRTGDRPVMRLND